MTVWTIMGLCLINHVDPLCFTSKAAALRLINGDQGPLKRRLVTDSVHLDTQGPPCRQTPRASKHLITPVFLPLLDYGDLLFMNVPNMSVKELYAVYQRPLVLHRR